MKYNSVTMRFEKEPEEQKKQQPKRRPKDKALFTVVDKGGREVDPKDIKEGKEYGLKEGE